MLFFLLLPLTIYYPLFSCFLLSVYRLYILYSAFCFIKRYCFFLSWHTYSLFESMPADITAFFSTGNSYKKCFFSCFLLSFSSRSLFLSFQQTIFFGILCFVYISTYFFSCLPIQMRERDESHLFQEGIPLVLTHFHCCIKQLLIVLSCFLPFFSLLV
jgi:hypothetical protein